MFPPFVSKSFDCRFVQARPWFRLSTWISSVAGIGFASCSSATSCTFLREARHSVWQTFPVVYLYPLCGSKIQDFYWLIKGGQLSNAVFDPYPFEAYVCLYMLRF